MKCEFCEQAGKVCDRCRAENARLAAARPTWQTLTEEGDERLQVRREAGGRLYRTQVRTRDSYEGWRTVAMTSLPDEPEHGR